MLWAEPTCREDPEQAADRRTGHSQGRERPLRRWLPAICHGLLGCPPPTDRLVAALVRSLDQRHGREPPVPNSPWVCILTDSVWVPAANVTVSWPSTSGSTYTCACSSAPSGGRAPSS